MSENHFYTTIDMPSYDETIKFLVHNQTDITFKIGADHFKSKILKMVGDKFFIYKFKLSPFHNQEVVCSFEISAEKYFFKSKISTEINDLVLNLPADIFKLQRRNDFRVAVPESMNYVCEITHINGYPNKIIAQIRDVSLGGIKLVCPVEGRKEYTDAEMILKIKIKDYELENIPCQVKRYIQAEGSSRAQIGLRFLDSSASFLTDLQSLLVYLDRVQRGKNLD